MAKFFSISRWAIVAALLGLGIHNWVAAPKTGDAVLPVFLVGLALFSAVSIIMSWNIAQWLARPFLRFIDSIYLPGGHSNKPPLSYDLPLYYERHFQGEEAAAAYEEIIHHYPEERRAYAGLVRVLESMVDGRDKDAKSWRTQGERLFGREELQADIAKTASQLYAEKLANAVAPLAPEGPQLTLKRSDT